MTNTRRYDAIAEPSPDSSRYYLVVNCYIVIEYEGELMQFINCSKCNKIISNINNKCPYCNVKLSKIIYKDKHEYAEAKTIRRQRLLNAFPNHLLAVIIMIITITGIIYLIFTTIETMRNNENEFKEQLRIAQEKNINGDPLTKQQKEILEDYYEYQHEENAQKANEKYN